MKWNVLLQIDKDTASADARRLGKQRDPCMPSTNRGAAILQTTLEILTAIAYIPNDPMSMLN